MTWSIWKNGLQTLPLKLLKPLKKSSSFCSHISGEGFKIHETNIRFFHLTVIHYKPSSNTVPKFLYHLKVNELKTELQKRGSKISGLKEELVGRLKTHLEEEGFNPDTFNFHPIEDISDNSERAPVSKKHSKYPMLDIVEGNVTKIRPSKVEKYPFQNNLKPLFSSLNDFSSVPKLMELRREENRGVKLPSVSKIMNVTMPKESRMRLQKWEDKQIEMMGLKNFMKMQQKTLATGTILHSNMETYFKSGSLPPLRQMPDKTSQNHLISIRQLIESFQWPPLGLESQVIHPSLNYVGYFDALTVHLPSKKVVLIDWKTSSRRKESLRDTFDVPLQIAAYVGALNHDSRYPYQIENAMIVYVYNDGQEANLINVDKIQLLKYWKIWLQRCSEYSKHKEEYKAKMLQDVQNDSY